MLTKNPYLSQILNPQPETVKQAEQEDGFDFKESMADWAEKYYESFNDS